MTSVRTVVIGTAGTVVVSFGCALYGFSVYATDHAAGSVFSTTTLSAAFAGAVITSGMSASPLGRWMDSHGVRTAIPTGASLVSLGLLLFSLATEPWHVLAAWWLVIGPGTAAAYYEPSFVAINQWVEETKRPAALGWLTVVGGLAGAVFIPLLERLTAWLGWRAAVRVAAGIVLVTSLATALTMLPRGRGPYALKRSLRGNLRELARDPVFVWFTLAMLLGSMALQAVIVHRLDLFSEAGLALPLVAAWAGAASLISLPGRYAAPVIGARTSLVGTTALVLILLAVASALAINGSGIGSMITHFVLFGLAFGAVTPLRALMMSHWYAGDRYGSVMGIQHTIILLGSSGGPLFVGVARDWSGAYSMPLIAVTALGTIAAMAVVMAGRASARREAVAQR